MESEAIDICISAAPLLCRIVRNSIIVSNSPTFHSQHVSSEDYSGTAGKQVSAVSSEGVAMTPGAVMWEY